MKNISKNLYRKEAYVLCSKNFFRESCLLWDNVEKYGTARQVKGDNKILGRKDKIFMKDN
jgi:hypothetical protein